MRGPDRLAAPDVLRGVAIVGTLASNVWLFTAPGGAAALLTAGLPEPGPVERGLLLLSNGKFLALLTLLFGAGIELQYRAAARRGRPWPGRYPLRAAVLFVEGLLHYLFVFEFDVLTGYAVASLVVVFLVGRSDRVVAAWVGVIGAAYVALLGVATAALVAAPAVAGPTGGTGSWVAQVTQRVDRVALFRAELVLVVPSAVVLFLVGSRLVRAGVFDPAGTALRRRLLVVGAVGLAGNVATTVGGAPWVLVDRYLFPPLVALGVLALGTEAVLRWRPGAVRAGLTAVGRTALSCYVLQNVLVAALCYDWGLGLATRFAGQRVALAVAVWAGVSLLLVLGASAWLRRYGRGPLELLGHRLLAPVAARP